MKVCLCGERGLYFCTTCRVNICREHKIKHKQENQRKCIFENHGSKLTSRQIDRISCNLSSKLKNADECEKNYRKH